MLINCKNKRKHDNVKYYKERFKLTIKCRFSPLNMNGFKFEGGTWKRDLGC